MHRQLQDSDSTNQVLDAILNAMPEPVFIFDEAGRYVNILGGADRLRYHEGEHLVGKRIHEVMDPATADRFLDQIRKAISTDAILSYTYQLAAAEIKGSEELSGPDGPQWFEAHISPIRSIEGQPRMVVWMAFNITPLRQTIAEKEALIQDRQRALREIKTLKGLLPICASCKKIRDDEGYWQQLESYLSAHSEAEFSHSICPECAQRLYPNFFKNPERRSSNADPHKG